MKLGIILAMIVCVGGCVSASAILVKPPIVAACQSRGIKGCGDLTDGVIAYIDGDKAQAETKILASAQANEPKQMIAFADALDKIATQFGVSDLKPVVALLKGERSIHSGVNQISPSSSEREIRVRTDKTDKMVDVRLGTYTDSTETCYTLSKSQVAELITPSRTETKYIIDTPTQILVCSDADCTKYSVVKNAILCVGNKCDKWFFQPSIVDGSIDRSAPF